MQSKPAAYLLTYIKVTGYILHELIINEYALLLILYGIMYSVMYSDHDYRVHMRKGKKESVVLLSS